MINTMKNLLEDLKVNNQMLEFINEYNKENYPIKWYENKAQIELLDYLIENFNDYIYGKEDKKIEMLELSNATINEQEIEFKINEIIDVINEGDK